MYAPYEKPHRRFTHRFAHHFAHHFTRAELAAEEIFIVLCLCLLLTSAGLATTSVLLPIKVTLVQCGTRAELPARCVADSRCCSFLKGAGGERPFPQDDNAAAVDEFEPRATQGGGITVTVPEQGQFDAE